MATNLNTLDKKDLLKMIKDLEKEVRRIKDILLRKENKT